MVIAHPSLKRGVEDVFFVKSKLSLGLSSTLFFALALDFPRMLQ